MPRKNKIICRKMLSVFSNRLAPDPEPAKYQLDPDPDSVIRNNVYSSSLRVTSNHRKWTWEKKSERPV
jgi:hypothetical protein